MSHKFEPPWSASGGCSRMVDDGDLCGQPADHPVHQVPNGNDEETVPAVGHNPGVGDVEVQVPADVAGENFMTRPGLPEPVLPYAGTSGWSGSETSRSTVVDQDNDGRTLDKQQQALRSFGTHNTYGQGEDAHYIGRSYGLTWRELDTLTSWGHGSTSRVLSDLHKAGLLARLSEVRNRCKVYVLPEYVGGRETEPHGGRGGDRLTPEEREAVRGIYAEAPNTLATLPSARFVGTLPVSTRRLTLLLTALDRLAPEPKGGE